MKTNIILIALALSLAACSSDEPANNGQTRQALIAFDVDNISSFDESRAYAELDYNSLKETGFAVYGCISTTDAGGTARWGFFFSKEQVQYDEESGLWLCTQNNGYWSSNTFRFFAVAPYSAFTNDYVSVNYGSAGTDVTTTFDNEKANGDVDLMWAYKEIKAAEGDDGSYANAPLLFRHALSRLKFKFTNVPENATITNVKLKDAILKGSNPASSGIEKNDSNYTGEGVTKIDTSTAIWTSINSGDLNLGEATEYDTGDYYTQSKFNIPYVVEKTVSIAYTVNGTTYNEDNFATTTMYKGVSYIIIVDLSFLNTSSDDGNDENGDNSDDVVPDATRAPKSARASRSHAKIIDEGQY
jgi:hypothetical protein